ncbi:Scramblase-domain-containing protein [Violaceomyces palustris]|uniref:Scramblase-domain-containing protein n=1 Tax=Violaceomyces palustris TaxID=1673888 RepID=A0ACD0P8R1_9BASI|nr:Scramblase-domain-containing protein [Violaceomyces palustris]
MPPARLAINGKWSSIPWRQVQPPSRGLALASLTLNASTSRQATSNPPVRSILATSSSRGYAALSRFPRGPRFARPSPPHKKVAVRNPTDRVGLAQPGPGQEPLLSEVQQQHQRQNDAENPAEKLVPTDPAIFTPAIVPEDPKGVLEPDRISNEGASKILGQSALVVTREIELMNIFVGYEQANKYSILSPHGEHLGFLAEEEGGLLGGALQRQLLKTHRPFRATIMDREGRPVLLIRRPLTWINSKASVYRVRPTSGSAHEMGRPKEEDLELIGEVQQRWHLYRRKYDLFLRRRPEDDEDEQRSGEGAGAQTEVGDARLDFDQFAEIDSGLLSWNFLMQDGDGKLVGAIDRNFRGFGREIFTDTGQYVLRFDSVGQSELTEPRLHSPQEPGQPLRPLGAPPAPEGDGMSLVESQGSRALTLDERAVALATAISIDFDYFSRHSSGAGGGGMFPWFYMGGTGGGGGEAPNAEGGPTTGQNPPSPSPGAADDGAAGTGLGGIGGGYAQEPPVQSEPGFGGEWGAQGGGGDGGEGGDFWPSGFGQGGGAGEEGDVWGTGNNDPWADSNVTEQLGKGFGQGEGGGGSGGGWFEGWGLGDFLPGGGD